jgi:hypothetical protein
MGYACAGCLFYGVHIKRNVLCKFFQNVDIDELQRQLRRIDTNSFPTETKSPTNDGQQSSTTTTPTTPTTPPPALRKQESDYFDVELDIETIESWLQLYDFPCRPHVHNNYWKEWYTDDKQNGKWLDYVTFYVDEDCQPQEDDQKCLNVGEGGMIPIDPAQLTKIEQASKPWINRLLQQFKIDRDNDEVSQQGWYLFCVGKPT